MRERLLLKVILGFLDFVGYEYYHRPEEYTSHKLEEIGK